MKVLTAIIITLLIFSGCNDQTIEILPPNYDYKYLKFIQYDMDGSDATRSKIILVGEKTFSNSGARILEDECGALYEEFRAGTDTTLNGEKEYVFNEINDRDASCDDPITITIKTGSRVLIYKHTLLNAENIGDLVINNCTQILVEEGAELVIWGDVDLNNSQIYALDADGNVKEDGYEQLYFLKGVNITGTGDASNWSTGYCSDDPFCEVMFCSDPALPITISEFNASKYIDIEIYLKTATEFNADYMVFYGSMNGIDWYEIKNYITCDNLTTGSEYNLSLDIGTGELKRN
jgi:hypothetical protein